MKRLITVTGRSRAGKDTIASLLESRLGLGRAVSYTDRPMRSTEVEGREHYFVSKDEMDELLLRSDVLVPTTIGDYRYCVLAESLNNNCLFIIDPYGLSDLKDNCEVYGLDVFSISVIASEDVRDSRKGRNDSHEYVNRCTAEDERLNSFENPTGFPIWDIQVSTDNGVELPYARIVSAFQDKGVYDFINGGIKV